MPKSSLKELETIKQKLSQSSFEERGALYRQVLDFAQTLKLPYCNWRLQHFSRFISQNTTIEQISLVLDVDIEDDLYELWGLTLHLPQREYYLPIHWLRSSWSDYNSSPFAHEITTWLTNLPLNFSESLWQHFQNIIALLWEDLAYWQDKTYIYKRSESYSSLPSYPKP